MGHPSVFVAGAVLAAAALVTALPANAADGSLCPPNGLTTTGQNSRGAYTVTWKGSDTSDPAICLSVGEGVAQVTGRRSVGYSPGMT
jgi:hypothetical protein